MTPKPQPTGSGVAYYNDTDPGAAAWLKELMAAGEIPHGVVDTRSIKDVQPDDLRGFVQCHFFAGIGVWPHALRRAGWPDDRPVWTGSCPCQPFSAAGAGLGFDDPRHVWPDFLRLIRERRPHQVLGEQVATADAWLDLVRADVEALGYAFAAVDLPAAGFDGAHIRQRFYWVADTDDTEWWSDHAPRNVGDWPETGRVQGDGDAGDGGAAGWLADAGGDERRAGRDAGADSRAPGESAGLRASGGLGDAHGEGLALGSIMPDERGAVRLQGPAVGATGTLRGCDWLFCQDGKLRPVEPGTFPLAATSPGRVGRLRGYGNALDAEVASQFVGAFLASERAAA